jgi:hypothetical protein
MNTAGLGPLSWHASKLAVVVGAAFLVMVFPAQITGHWKSEIGDGEFKMLLRKIDAPTMVHPTF